RTARLLLQPRRRRQGVFLTPQLPSRPRRPSRHRLLFPLRLPRAPTLFPYTTLFRSFRQLAAGDLSFGPLPRPGSPCHGCRHVGRSEEHTSELQSRENLVCRLLLEKKKSSKTSKNDTAASPVTPSTTSPAASAPCGVS